MTLAVSDVNVANKFFLVLTLCADAAVILLALVGASGRLGERARDTRTAVVDWIGPQARVLALFVAGVATAGSLYYSEVAHFVPCELCWYQRICVYPLVAILAVGVARRDTATWMFAAPFVVVGVPLGIYHWLVERVPAIADTTACSAAAPCAIPYFEELGFVTLAFMSMSALLLVGALLWVGRVYDHETEESE